MDRVVEKKKFTIKKVASWFGVALILTLILFFYLKSGGQILKIGKEKLTISKVQKAEFREYIAVTGVVQPIKTVFLDALEGGTVQEKFVEDGIVVEAGTPILRLSNQQFHMDAINREAQLLDQQNNLRNTRIQMDQQTAQLREELLQIDHQLIDSKRKYEINQSLLTDKLIAKNDFDRSKEDYNFLVSKRKLIRQKITTDSLFRRNQIGQIESSLQLIERNLLFLNESKENLIIKAPISGQLSSLKAELGETKSKGENIAQIDLLNDFKIRASIAEHYISRIFIGLKGEFTFAGKVYLIAVNKIYPEVTNGEFFVDLLFEEEKPEGIKRGQTLQIKLALGDEDVALLLPRGGFFQVTGGKWVFVVNEKNEAIKREVTLGRQNPDFYEVLEGLSEGDQVITSKYDLFNDAEKLIIE